MKVICKMVIKPKYTKPDKSWTKGKTYIANKTGYDKFSIKDNSGCPTDFSLRELQKHFDIIHNGNNIYSEL